MVFVFLAYFTLYNGLQFHPSHYNWVKLILFNGWVIFHGVYVPQRPYALPPPPQLSSFAETLSPIMVVFGDWVHWKLNRVSWGHETIVRKEMLLPPSPSSSPSGYLSSFPPLTPPPNLPLSLLADIEREILWAYGKKVATCNPGGESSPETDHTIKEP